MFFLVWRGYGLVALIPPVLGLIALGALADHSIKVACLGVGLTVAVTALAASIAGWVLNRNGNHHSLYGLPLWAWGGLEALLGLVLVSYVWMQVVKFGWQGDFRSDRGRPTAAEGRIL